MFKKIKYYVWYFYFCAYWSAYHWGEKNNPGSNASNLFGIVLILVASAILQAFQFLGYGLLGWPFFLICILPALILPGVLFKKKKVNSKISEFDFLKVDSYHRKRVVFVVVVLLFFIMINSGIAIARNLLNV